MAQKTVVLVGRDAAPSKLFNLLKPELEKAGWTVVPFIGNGKDLDSSLLAGPISKADVVLCGMSAPAQNAKSEIEAALIAEDYYKPYGFYADTWGASARPWFESVRDHASFVFVLNNEDEVEKTKSLYRVARVLKSGNPEWEEASVQVYSREEIRAKLGITMESKVVLVPGHKSLPITNFLLVSTLHALHQYVDYEWVLLYAPHPGDGVSPMMYRDAVEFSDVRVMIVGKDKMVLKENGKIVEREGGYPTGHLLPAADVMVESASTFCMAAAIQRIPIVSFFSEVSKLRNIPTFGQREWEPVEQEVAVEVYGDIEELGEEIYNLAGNRYYLLAEQEELYPPQEQGRAVRMVVEELEYQFQRPKA